MTAGPGARAIGGRRSAPARSWLRRYRPARATPREHDLHTARMIGRWVTLTYYLASLVIFRDVLAAIPDVLSGRSVIVGDELVPFFNPHSQLLEQAAGLYNELTNGYEFRVRYAFLTTWVRQYQVLPFAILLVIPTIFVAAYRFTAGFLIDVFRALSPVSVAIATAFPVTLIYLIVIYAKITHFYTLGIGLVMMSGAILYLLRAILFTGKGWIRQIVAASLLILLNPAVHYLVLFTVFFAVAGVTLAIGEFARWIRKGGPARLRTLPGRVIGLLRSSGRFRRTRAGWRRWRDTTLGRGVIGGLLFTLITLIPYALFVKYVALRGVANLSETVPGDYYFIRDASVSWLHVLSWDLAGIMDKVLYGDYLAKVPRYPNLVYTLLFFAPLVIPHLRHALAVTRPHRQMLGVVYVVSVFAIWATIGYAEPQWFPSFHRSLSAITRTLYSTGTPLGNLALDISSSVVQVLRFPHRFQLILFALAPMVMSLTLAWGIDTLHRLWLGLAQAQRPGTSRDSHVLRAAAAVILAITFFVPFWSNTNYRETISSGNWGTFLAPYPVDDLADLKRELLALPTGKTVVFPPTETAKLVEDDNGIDHKFIDKFYIYYLDTPSFYYGLTGDSQNKYEFFLILRGLYYQQDWWINPARDIGLRYIVVNKMLHGNNGVGAEYLPDVESYIGPAMERQVELGLMTRHYENDSYVLYEISSERNQERRKLVVDSSWSKYLELVWNRLELSRCYDLEYLPFYTSEEATGGEPPLVYTDDPEAAAVDLWTSSNPGSVFSPTPKTFPFDDNVVASSYYLSPMFREFLLFSNTKWNRTGMITPGVFGTLKGSFIGVPRPTAFTVPVKVPQDGRYRVLLRGAFGGNDVKTSSTSLGLERTDELRSSADALQFYSIDAVYTPDRVPVDTSAMTVEELAESVGAGELVPVNSRFDYVDLGVVEASAGSHTIKIAKTDTNPILVEGIVLVPEETYAGLEAASDLELITSVSGLECGTVYPVFGPNTEGFVDPAAHDAHEDLSNQELLDLAASGVSTIAPDASGGLGADWLVLVLAGGLLVASVLTVVSRTRARPDDPVGPTPEPDRPPSDPDPEPGPADSAPDPKESS